MASAIKATYGDEVTVTITADKFYSETTSFAAGGLWEVCVCVCVCYTGVLVAHGRVLDGTALMFVSMTACVSPICSEIRRMS